ncbi:hypothetical protein [Piscinibacterium candidicorallinum]|jgi:hypothetical protein|uniref:Uncharacterized protein n=1 Tax=Piscinibacterium candidicorallinum TaxID=1793872 RepID=A0ABV7H147_9BURK
MYQREIFAGKRKSLIAEQSLPGTDEEEKPGVTEALRPSAGWKTLTATLFRVSYMAKDRQADERL